MVYYILVGMAKLIPGFERRRRFVEWARARFSVRAIVDAALAEQRGALERVIYRAEMVEPPSTMTIDETLDALIDGRSIARFGDGEFMTMEGRFDVFQTPSAELTRRLEEVLTSDEPGLMVAIPVFTYDLNSELSEGMRDYCMREAPWMREFMKRYLRPGQTYAATEMSLVHSSFRASFDRSAYFEKCRRIWDGADVTLVHGEGIFDGFAHDIFDNAASVQHVLAPREDAFRDYDDILERTRRLAQDTLVIAILGPTATVLAYDLHRVGYRAVDLGHVAKAYDWWKRGRATDEPAASDEFFASD